MKLKLAVAAYIGVVVWVVVDHKKKQRRHIEELEQGLVAFVETLEFITAQRELEREE